jgi:hypothetical protein
MGRPPYQVVCIALATSLVVMGDILLYAVLPLHHQALGLTAFEVGVLLSVNRWVRLLSNTVAERCLRRGSVTAWLLLMLALGSLWMVVYATTTRFWLLLVARMGWGICFSFLRHAGIFTAVRAAAGRRVMERVGWYRGLATLGMFAGAVIGGWGYDRFGYAAILLAFAAVSLAALPLGWCSQTGRVGAPQPASTAGSRPTADRGWWLDGFSLGLVGSGIVMSTLGLVLAREMGEGLAVSGGVIGVATITGLVLGGRAVLDGLAAPVLGAAFDRVGSGRVEGSLYLCGAVVLVIATLGLGPWVLLSAVGVVFLCATSLGVLLTTSAALVGSRTVAAFVTAYDLGSATGPLIGWTLFHFGADVRLVFWVAAAAYLASAARWLRLGARRPRDGSQGGASGRGGAA